jgi:hypothetical protein
MPHPRIPEREIKSLSIRNKSDPKKNNKKNLATRMGGLIMSHPIMFIGT